MVPLSVDGRPAFGDIALKFLKISPNESSGANGYVARESRSRIMRPNARCSWPLAPDAHRIKSFSRFPSCDAVEPCITAVAAIWVRCRHAMRIPGLNLRDRATTFEDGEKSLCSVIPSRRGPNWRTDLSGPDQRTGLGAAPAVRQSEARRQRDHCTIDRAMLKAGSSYCRAMSRTCRRYRYRVQFRPRSEAARPPAGSGRCDLAASP